MSKVLVERPRRGGKWDKGRSQSKMHGEVAPKQQSVRRAHRDRKHFNDNLKPLERFLKSRVGKPWNKVFSEICENIKPSSTVQAHIRSHVKQLVELNVRIEEDAIYYKAHGWRTKRELFPGSFYVHPKSGLLFQYKQRKRWRHKANPHNDAFHRALNSAIRTHSTVVIEGVLYKKFAQSYERANATHARQDFKSGSLQEWGRFFHEHWRRFSSYGGSYVSTLVQLYNKAWKEREQEEAAMKRKALQEKNESA